MSSSVRVTPEHRFLIDLCLEHIVQFFWRGPGLLLIRREGIRVILTDLDRRGMKILGLEGFELDGNDIHPRLDLIFDADRSSGSTAQEAIETWPNEIWVDVTIGQVL